MASKKVNLSIYKDLTEIPMPTQLDIRRTEVAALTCKTNEDFAEALGVEPIIIKYWCRKSSAFYKAFNSWKDAIDADVERALAKRAVGFTKRTTKEIMTRQGTVEKLVSEEYFPPDTAAINTWLKNRKPDEWKDSQQIDINVHANIRAWLVNAMSDQTSDDSEIIDITPNRELEALPKPEEAIEVTTKPTLKPATVTIETDSLNWLNSTWR